jgi:hypothetical protein
MRDLGHHPHELTSHGDQLDHYAKAHTANIEGQRRNAEQSGQTSQGAGDGGGAETMQLDDQPAPSFAEVIEENTDDMEEEGEDVDEEKMIELERRLYSMSKDDLCTEGWDCFLGLMRIQSEHLELAHKKIEAIGYNAAMEHYLDMFINGEDTPSDEYEELESRLKQSKILCDARDGKTRLKK